jgi:adenylate kinase
MKKPKNFILIGPPGCGKGTQAKLLLERFKNFYYISTGKLFRKLSATKTDTGERVKKVVESGGLPFDDLATTLWMHEIAFNVEKKQGIIADGFPRRPQEAKDFDIFLRFLERKNTTLVFFINISEKEALRRLPKRGRADDEVKDIKRRFRIYRGRTIPAINYLKNNFKFIEINGERPIEEVFKDILKHIHPVK